MSGQSLPQAPPRPMKVEMKTLFIPEETRKDIMKTLRFIHGQSFSLRDPSEYKDKGLKLDRKYWVDTGTLYVQGVVDANTNRRHLLPHEQLNLFAINKLKRYGFHECHCTEALRATSGDVGLAYELLISRYFDFPLNDPVVVPSDILEERQQELESLQVIYENQCDEKIQNQLWIVHLDLEYLTGALFNRRAPQHEGKKPTRHKEVCRNFLKGYCKYGGRCRFSHEPPPKKEVTPQAVNKDLNKYELEIRFPMGCRYPKEPPLVCLVAVLDEIPKNVTLRITQHLLKKAIVAAESEMPCIFELIDSLLNGQQEIISIAQQRYVEFFSPDEKLYPEQPAEEEIVSDVNHNQSMPKKEKIHDPEKTQRENQDLFRSFLSKKMSPMYKTLRNQRVKLPAWGKREEILQGVRDHQVLIISGETGCGKSTQIPQYLLDDWLSRAGDDHCEIVCTQPRKISAIGVAQRVAYERCEKIAESVGYQIRLETKTSSMTRLFFCTTGILLRRLEGDPNLSCVTHLVIDEAHERSEEIDFLLTVLRDLLPLRQDLKVILMSATLNINIFSDYFAGPPIINIPGRTFPVEDYFLEDILEETNYTLEENSEFARRLGKGEAWDEDLETELKIADVDSAEAIPNPKTKDHYLTIRQMYSRYSGYSMLTKKTLYMINQDRINNELMEMALLWIMDGIHEHPKTGSILVFLPGMAEITSLHEHLRSNKTFLDQALLIPLHSSLSNEEQALIFNKVPPGKRKIILSTNIAETSITIDDCVFVIDTGKMKEKRFDSNKNMESLDTVWVSKANAQQRKGRAGRIMAGVCIHLYTRHTYEYEFIAQPIPELHRVPLEQTLLKIKLLPNFKSKDVYSVLGKFIEPPSKENIAGGLSRLKNLGALGDNSELTPLGHHLASLPVDVRIGKLILYGTIFSCVDAALTIAACLSFKNPFLSPFSKKEEASAKKREFLVPFSDHLTVLKAYRKWLKVSQKGKLAGRTFAEENFLSHRTLTTLADIKGQFIELLGSIGFLPESVRCVRRRTGVDQILEITGSELNANGDNTKLLSAIICASLYPNIVSVLTPPKNYVQRLGGLFPDDSDPEKPQFETKNEKVFIHPSSVNYGVNAFPCPYLVYQEKVKTSQVFIRDCSLVTVIPLVLFTPCVVKVDKYGTKFVIVLEDTGITFIAQSSEIAELIERIKQEFMILLDEKIRNPNMDLQSDKKGKQIISTIVRLVTQE